MKLLNTIIFTFSLLIICFNNVFANSKPELDIRFQKDLYIQKNTCGNLNRNYHDAIYVNHQLEEKWFNKKIIIQFEEKNSHFFQTLLYTIKTFFYPTLFGSLGHHEYETQNCDSGQKNCDFGYFIFANSELKKQKKLDLTVNLYEVEGHNFLVKSFVNFQIDNYIDNKFEKKMFENIDFSMNPSRNEFNATLDRAKIQSLIDDKYKIAFIFSWRENMEQQAYSEESWEGDKIISWLKENKSIFSIKRKITNPSYLSFMVYVKKDFNSYESKIEVLNKKNKFYNCK